MALLSQPSTSSTQTANTSTRTTRRSNQLVYEGQYEESDEEDYELFEDDNFADSDEEDADENKIASSKKRKTDVNAQTKTDGKEIDKRITNTEDKGTTAQADRKRKKKDASSKNKKVERLVWQEKKEHFSIPLPRFRQPDSIHDYALSSPLVMFQLFFTDSWFSSIVSFMNSYSMLTTHYNINTNVAELKSFISIHIYMGIHQLPRKHMYWSDEHRYDFITSLMSRDRFQSLNSAFCLSIGDQGIVIDDPAIHCNDFINHLNNVLPTLYSPGQHLSFDEAMCAYQCGDMSLVMWKDSKIIKVLCNHISPFTIDTTTKRYNDNREQFDASCPQALHDYFHRARDIDIFDQLSNSYIIGRKSVNQRSRLIWWLINLCVVNAYTLYKHSHTDITQLDFRVLLYKSLASQQQPKINASTSAVASEYGVPSALEHYLVHSGRHRDCKECSNRATKRVKSVYWCASCKKNLCVGNCFYVYHKKKYNQ
jgi:hypothetical protein